MQSVSADWANKVNQGMRRIGYGVLVAWMRTAASGVNFFTINQSTIGGGDIIKSGGSYVAFFDKYQFDDVTPFVTSITVKKKMGQYPYGLFIGESDIELDNTTKKFLPGYDTTIGSGILPNRPVKVTIGIEDEYLKLFTGYTSQPVVSLNNRVVNMHAFDAMNFISGYTSTISGGFINAPFQNVVASGLAEMGFSSSQYILDKSLQQNIGYLPTNNRKWGDIFRDGCEAEQAMLFVGEDGIVRLWNRQHFLTGSGVALFQLSYSNISDIQVEATGIINDVEVISKPRTVGSSQRVWASTTTYEILGGADLDVFCDFTDDYGELPVTTVQIPGPYTTYSGSASKFQANADADGLGTDRTSSVSVIDAYNFGNTYKLTFRNAFTSSVHITDLQIFGTPARVREKISERVTDATSIEIFGRNPSNNGEPLVIENNLIQDKDTAKSLAYTLVEENKWPRRRFICPLVRGSNPAIQIGDVGQILIEDTGELKTVYVTGYTHVINREGLYQQALEVEEKAIKSYFTINQSAIGGSDSIAP